MEGEVTNKKMQQRDQNPVFLTDRIATTKSYLHAHNPVLELEEVRFELHKSLPQAKPLFKKENLLLVRRLIEQHPKATLQQLCEMVQREKGFRVYTSSMHRAQMRLGLRRKERKAQG